MTENGDIHTDTESGKLTAHNRKVRYALAILILAAAVYAAARFLLPGSEPVYEIRAGTAAIRVPAPKGATFYTPERESGDGQAAFANVKDGKGETIGYTLTGVDDTVYTPERFADLLKEMRREFSGTSPLLRTEILKQAIFQRAGMDLKQVEARQREENGALVREVQGTMTEKYATRRASGAQLLFLFQSRLYLITVIIFAPTGSPGRATREAWKWHGEIVAANPGT